jgi:hypothetical protein
VKIPESWLARLAFGEEEDVRLELDGPLHDLANGIGQGADCKWRKRRAVHEQEVDVARRVRGQCRTEQVQRSDAGYLTDGLLEIISEARRNF